MDKTLGFDSSQWQDDPDTATFIDGNKAVAAGAKFAIPRFSYGRTPDRIAPRAFDVFKAAGMVTGAYQFADYTTYAKINVAKLIEHLAGRQPDLLAIDLEPNESYWPGQWPSDPGRLTYWIQDWLNAFKSTSLKCKVLLYTNPDTLKQMRSEPVILANLAQEMDLWMTGWNGVEPPKADIVPWSKWTIWQPVPTAVGHQYGMESGNLDLDYYNGNLDSLIAYVGKTTGGITGSSTQLDRIETKLDAILGKLGVSG